MSVPTPRPNDPLAAMAKSTAQAVQSEETARAERDAAREETARSKSRLLRAGVVLFLGAIVAVTALVLVRSIGDPYHGVDPLADPAQARAYAAALLDSVMEWSSRHGGELPRALDEAVPQSRMLPAGSAYRLEYRVEGGVPLVVLEGGKEPLVVRGGGR